MKRRLLPWLIWLLTFGASIWLGFRKQWSTSAWVNVGLVFSVLLFNLSFMLWQRRFVRKMASLPAEERQRRLAAMSTDERGYFSQLMKCFGAGPGSVPNADPTQGHGSAAVPKEPSSVR